jgi:hypothetical protein
VYNQAVLHNCTLTSNPTSQIANLVSAFADSTTARLHSTFHHLRGYPGLRLKEGCMNYKEVVLLNICNTKCCYIIFIIFIPKAETNIRTLKTNMGTDL